MPVILQVNYTPSEKQQATPVEARVASAERIAALPGLHWKFWVSEPASGERGGIYLFADQASAEAWAKQVSASLAAAGGTNLSIRYLAIDEGLSAITRATLTPPVAQAAE